ncbi:DnaJ domain-containing protein [Histoplasma capsulatum G186AR]|uniref:DnaJ domain-containing protein n=1 Tax=Ajellomyces capsulatus (strain G186AR / H82 / ATCC MYA-2454 / RMSCC 2432) TaxID=447093 RepID=C0NL17_AJECG|nr:DnaJ domain-containing protein [Histoplasma capsulatum G186AR]EEH08558.1 DnaJ domain-containing protein [Histoplasma capsulatum G186AR]
MVKADIKKDYYADLGLDPKAEDDEIRKKYRKLGQSRGTPTPAAQPRRPSEPNAQHHPQSFPHPGSYPAPPSAGAQKYTSYAKATSQKWDKIYEDTRTRADAFRGFRGMKPNVNTGGWSGFDPRTGRSNQSGSTPQPSQRPQSAYEAFFNAPKASPQRAQAKKRQGFAPGTPGGDEPMAQNTSAYASYNRDRTSYFQSQFESAPAPTAKKWPPQEESTNNNSTIPNLQRTSSKYATAGGEKTYVSSAGVGRSSSSRNSPFTESDSRPRTNPPSPTSPRPNRGRHHSASPKLKPNRNRNRTISSSPSPSDSEEVDISSRPKRTPRSRMFAKTDPMTMETDSGHHPNNVGFNPHASHGYAPAAKDHPQQAPTTANNPPNHATGNPSENLRKSHKTENSNNMYGPSPKSFIREWSERWGFTSSTTPSDTPDQSFPLWAYPSSILPQLSKLPNWRKEDRDQSFGFPITDEIAHDGPQLQMNPLDSTQNKQTRMKADPVSIPSFGPFASNNITLNGKPKSRSHESIDVTFSATDWSGKFQHATEFFAPKPSREPPFQPKPSRARGKSISRPNSTTHPRPFPPPGSTNQNQRDDSKKSSHFTESGFSVDKWKEEVLKADIWSIPHNELPHQNPTRQKSPPKQPKPVMRRKQTIPKPVSVTTESEEAESTLSPGNTDEPKSAPEGVEAMDIDEELPASKPQRQHPAAPNPKIDSTVKPPIAGSTKPAPSPPLSNNTLNLKHLANVAPFTPTNSTGINDLNDLSSTLPFESRPNDSSGPRLTIRPQDLALPKPPRVPPVPNFSAADHPHKAEVQLKWERYVTEINAYMHDWNVFNRTMLGHFNARQQTVETGLAPNWARAVGDSARLRINDGVDSTVKKANKTTVNNDGAVQDGDDDNDADDEQLVAGSAKGGFNAYMRGVKEDFVVRQHWEVAWERHLACLETLDATRRFMRGGTRQRRMSAGGVVG